MVICSPEGLKTRNSCWALVDFELATKLVEFNMWPSFQLKERFPHDYFCSSTVTFGETQVETCIHTISHLAQFSDIHG